MARDAVGAEPRYWAFISYSHKDAAFGRQLHRRLESYFLPRRLVGRSTTLGVAPRRLVPIFRDREEFPAAADLTAEVRAALAQSRCLVVVCSPDAAASIWVSREVELFRALHPTRPALAALRDGNPAQSFPPPMFGPGVAGERIEPLAADFRPNGDGTHLGLLKLVAGITGVGLDELVQRDAQRNLRRVTAVTAAALVAVLVMGALTFVAIRARQEAERQRGEAEGLVEFMLTDLRDRLKGVGRLDVMTAVNQRAFRYYADQDLSSLPPVSLERRARILHAMGEDEETQGDHAAALSKFQEAERTTAVLLNEAPNDAERIFDQAQSVYWMGYEDYTQGRSQAARKAFLRYRALSLRMVALAPTSTKYRREMGYAESDLCAVALQKPIDNQGAMQHCGAALTQTEIALHHPDRNSDDPDTRKSIENDLMNSLGNMADAYRVNHDIARARAQRREEEKLVDSELAGDSKNMDLKDTWITIQMALAELDREEGHREAAVARLIGAKQAADSLHHFDPSNLRSINQLNYIKRKLAELAN